MSDLIEEYRTIVRGAGWVDVSGRGRIAVEGADRRSFLQALVSNDVDTLAVGAGTYATYLTPQGRMICDLEIYHRPEEFVVEVPDGMGPRLASRLDEVIFTEDVRIVDLTGTTCEIAVVGARAAAVVSGAANVDPGALAGLPELSQVDTTGGFVVRSAEASLPFFKIVAPAAERDGILAGLGGTRPLSAATAEFLRIEAGRPAFGVDMTEETIPLEAGLLERGISTSKGCYVGQEIVIRILHRGGGRVAKRLVKLAMPAGVETPQHGDRLLVADREVGRITSAAVSPVDGTILALGYLQREFAEMGRRVLLGSSGTEATVTGFAA